MRIGLSCVLLTFCWALSAACQSTSSVTPSLAGCYEIKTSKWKPPLEDDPHLMLIPSRVRLSTQSEPNQNVFKVESIPINPDGAQMDRLWFWIPEGTGLRLLLGAGSGGFRGRLKRTNDGDFSGKLKQWCNGHCDWKRTEVMVRLSRINCSALD